MEFSKFVCILCQFADLISLSQDRICFEGTKMALQVSKSLQNNRTIFNSQSWSNVTYLSAVNHIFFSRLLR